MLRSHEGWLSKCIHEEDAAKHHASGNWIGLRAVHFGTKFTAEEVSETGHQEKVVFVVLQGPQIQLVEADTRSKRRSQKGNGKFAYPLPDR